MKIALAQINPTVGDIAGNLARIREQVQKARALGADLVLGTELALTGYPPKDLLLKRAFVQDNLDALQQLAADATDIAVGLGFVAFNESDRGKGLFNSFALLAGGKVAAVHRKVLLPTYDVFDESRYFEPGKSGTVARITLKHGPVAVGMSICEDLWSDDVYFSRSLYTIDPIAQIAEQGAEVILNIGASPFAPQKPQRRVELFSQKAEHTSLPTVYVNQVGGNDDLVFDGASGAFDAIGRPIARAKSFTEDLLLVDLKTTNRIEPLPDDTDAVLDALILGTRDYVAKCGFDGVVIGLSGGIDSALTAAVAAQALGPDRIHLVAMPSRFSSDHSLADAQELAQSLGADFRVIPIEPMHAAAEEALGPHFEGRPCDTTEENIQARIRGGILMALSNKFGWLVLTTGNKSELAVGYCTLYGDMCGGLAVISDVPKTLVYKLARRINERAGRAVIPERTLTKPPSAELRPNQTDQDSLPPYDLLDDILERYIEKEQSAREIIDAGFDERVVLDVIRKVDRNEYKRKQAAIGLKVTSRAFGTGRPMPVAAKY